jgi:acyl carrier protein
METTKTIEQRIKDIVIEFLGVNPDEITSDSLIIDDLGADSLDTVEIVMALEEEFDIEIPDEDVDQFNIKGDATVGQIVDYITTRCATKPS